MLFRICSDLHLELGNYRKDPTKPWEYNSYTVLDKTDNDKEQTLLLAGDICEAVTRPEHYTPFFGELSERFKRVFYVPGNHEHYRGSFFQTHPTLRENLSNFKNIRVMDREYYVFDENYVIHAATLWTCFGDGKYIEHARYGMSDYRYVNYVHGEPLQPEHTLKVHQETVEKMCESLKDSKNWNLKIICMTHHLPSERSVDKEFEGSPLNYAFFSNLEPVIEKFKPLLWVHGHTHKPCDYKIGDTRVVANPLGYGFGKENKNFNESLIIEV